MISDWKLNGNIVFSKPSDSYSLTEFCFPDNTDFIKEMSKKINSAKTYSLEQLKDIESRFKSVKSSFKSRGFISFTNYMKEVNDPNSRVINEKLPVRGTSHKSVFAKKHFEKIQVVAVNPNSFMPTKEQKEAGIWDENSDQAFTMSVFSLLNRLTQQNMQLTIKELRPLLINKEKNNFVATTLTEKASQEHAFASLYASFTSKLKFNNLENMIITKAKDKFFEYCKMNLSDDSDTHDLTGCAKFVACLIKMNSLSVKDGIICLGELINGLEVPKISSSSVEMFLIFVQNIGADFAKKVPAELWDRFLKAKRERELTSRVKYLLEDVEEIYSEIVLNVSKKQQRAASKPLPAHSDSKMFLVRDSFSNYKEGGKANVDLPINEFLRAAGDLFPDQTRDSAAFCEFICDVCESKGTSATVKKVIIDILGKCAAEYCKNKIEGDSPKMWALFDDLLYYLMIRRLLNCEDVKKIMENFPELHESDIVNGMKWFLCDKHYFTKAIDIPDFPSPEVRDALMMPATIHKPIPDNLLMSRLIALSIIRSIAVVICETENPFEELKKFVDYLILIEDKQIGFDEEWSGIIAEYNFDFTVDDIYDIIDGAEEEEEFNEET